MYLNINLKPELLEVWEEHEVTVSKPICPEHDHNILILQ